MWGSGNKKGIEKFKENVLLYMCVYICAYK